jgi:hypothetical protein
MFSLNKAEARSAKPFGTGELFYTGIGFAIK